MRHSIVCSAMALLCFSVLSGCASNQFQYVPAERPANNDRRTNQAIYSVPANSPTGSIRVSSVGVVDVKPQESGQSTPAVHVKIAVSNERDHASWKFDPMDQFLALPNQAEVRPLPLKPDTGNPQKIVEILPGQLRVIDLYFPLPGVEASAKNLPEFDFHWRIQAGQNYVKNTTLFDRIEIPDPTTALYPYGYYPYGPYPYAMGWGPG